MGPAFYLVPFVDHSLVVAKRLLDLDEAVSHAVRGHPGQTGHSEELQLNVVHWRRRWPPIPVFLLQEHHEQYEKAKR